MNKLSLTGFKNEMEKDALLPAAFVKWLTKLKVNRIARAAERRIIRDSGRTASKAARIGGKDVDAASYIDDIVDSTKKVRVPQGEAIINKAINPETAAAGQGFVSKHKGKLLLGGAAGGALYLASRPPDPQKEEEERARLAMRNLNIPQAVYNQ